MQKQYCDGHFPDPILSAGNSTSAGYYSTQGFFKMENALDKIIISIEMETEKRSIMGHWKKCEKQIDKVVLNTNFMYNSIKAIAGNAIKEVKALEIPVTNNELDF